MDEYPSWQLHLAVIDLRLCGQDAAPGVGGRGVNGSDVLTARLHERALGEKKLLKRCVSSSCLAFTSFSISFNKLRALSKPPYPVGSVFCANPKKVCFCELPRTAGLISEQAGAALV